MDLGLAGRNALVTGGGRGIGRGIAQALAAEGARVAVVARTLADVDETVTSMGGVGVGHLAIAMDLTPEGAPAAFEQELRRRGFGPIDIVVHNMGGTLDITDPFCSLEDWRRVSRFNIEVAIELNLLLLPHMREQRWGRVVHISSISAVENHGPIPYCSVKAALNAYTRSLGRVVAPDGVVVTAVLPGAVMTEGGYWEVASAERPEHVEKYLADRMAIHRFGHVDEVSRLVAFLCSEHASFCIGSIVPVDGGQGRGFFG
ncbi:MAG: SDR family oxidoreductase [Dehalococcoidia bacterium]|nr:MAG: SDR family oxidoreductase [Dehalococcoidia bacterium]